jgi:hypothetical protein
VIQEHASLLRRTRFVGRDGPTQYAICSRVADHSTIEGAQLTKAELGEAIGRSERTVRRQMIVLAARGILEVVKRTTAGGKQLANTYRLIVQRARETFSPAATPEPTPPPAPEPTPAPPTPPPPLSRRVFANGGCVHEMPACDECRAHG